ncbi:methyl-CpG-binding domain protein 1b isoform 2-T2 [Clarias gariepinus]|uniref:methyl-CpG-binding domain protein 1b isoform X2 n=1 Tax=Clarias gariepinus TaxID=13013 RepID=UPI00234DE996|nr:methyl-CpG-binding domain protein 1b isoform X2 [Clarias gariepinus]
MQYQHEYTAPSSGKNMMEEVAKEGKPMFSSTETSGGQSGSLSEPVKSLDDPPVDWFEPLEEDCEADDDAHSWDVDGVRDAEMESLAGESERSGSVAGSERNYRGRGGGGGAVGKRKRKWRFGSDDGWQECPVLGEGWKRKVVLRRSGVSVGQRDVYYLSPKGDRVRSKIELLKSVGNTVDLTNFDFKTGSFFDGQPPKRGMKRRKMDHSSPVDCGFSSESSFHNEVSETYDRTYSPGPPYSLSHIAQQRLSPLSQKDVSSVPSPGTSNATPNQAFITHPTAKPTQNVTSKAGFLSQTKVPAKLVEGTSCIPSNSCLGICARCRNSFTSVEGQTMCEKCSKACNASKDNRKITFRKWLPCGFCRACQLTEDCGVCASCRNGKLNPQNRRPIRCRRRKCLCPSLKKRADDVFPLAQCGSAVQQSMTDLKESQYSDSDDQSPVYEENDSESLLYEHQLCEGNSPQKGLLRKFRRSCGRCKGCVAKADCGTCDYCIDKPKFGGSNKKRQKCRQRQCQREAKGWTTPGRPRLHYTYSHNILQQNREKWDFEFSDNECEKERVSKGSVVVGCYLERDKHRISDYNGQVTAGSWSSASCGVDYGSDAETETSQSHSEDHLLHLFYDEWTKVNDRKRRHSLATSNHTEEMDEDEVEPTITQIFSLGGDDVVDDGLDLELLELLASLRDAPLPVLWCAVLAEGPLLQLLQCSKLSAMADTMVQIEPSFRYHISVQGQPLLPTHWLYHAHPAQLTSVTQVVTLLEDLERYHVCQGFKSESPSGSEPVVQVRAATCEFLVVPETQCCARCKNAQQKH